MICRSRRESVLISFLLINSFSGGFSFPEITDRVLLFQHVLFF
jgi:hypothetical protein